MTDPHKSYQALLDKVAALGARQKEAFGSQIRCRKGCYECCHPPDSLFRVEAQGLQQAVARLSSQERSQVSTQLTAYELGQRSLCPLLNEAEEGRCMAYEGRPSICRTQGYALWLRHDEGERQETGEDGALSWCELNFTQETPDRVDAFDIERLNVMMSLMTQLGWPDLPPRVSLIELLKEALSQDDTTSEEILTP